MYSANSRGRRSCQFGLEQISDDKVYPAAGKASKQSNACAPPPLKTLKESPNGGNLHGETMEDGKGVSGEENRPNSETGKKISNNGSSGSHTGLVVLGLPCNGQSQMRRSRGIGGAGERHVLVSTHKRAQNSKETVGSSSVDAPTPVERPRKRKKKNMKEGKVIGDDEYIRIKKKLRYILSRINYEQNLIDAYSLEGWKGSSLEKLRPEKELERAKKEILQCKVKIRDLFQHLDTLCAQGSLPESLFDSDGEISSEDIFCAKCGSKDLSLENDIILCDGFCDRGFHQYCLEPPLRKEDVPPDDESWLCSACDCKDESFDLLNDSLGTKLSVNDSWEKVFPEAAAALAGGDPNLNCDLPSDDSDDEEYSPPDGMNDDDDEGGSDESENEDGSCDESDSTSASDEMMIGSFKSKDIMDLPSDDSEDDDYDPDASTLDEDKQQESSKSDSETSSKGDEGLEEVPGRRNVERLDYKKLYDEEYENVPSSSSDDEDWDKTVGNEEYESADERGKVSQKQSVKAEETKTPIRKSERVNKKDTLEATQETPGESSSSSACKQSNLKTQRLLQTFQENRYPDNTTKESLAKELQMTLNQVQSWFRNRRHKMVVDAEKLTTGKQGEGRTPSAGSSKQTKSVAERKSRVSKSSNTKRR